MPRKFGQSAKINVKAWDSVMTGREDKAEIAYDTYIELNDKDKKDQAVVWCDGKPLIVFDRLTGVFPYNNFRLCLFGDTGIRTIQRVTDLLPGTLAIVRTGQKFAFTHRDGDGRERVRHGFDPVFAYRGNFYKKNLLIKCIGKNVGHEEMVYLL